MIDGQKMQHGCVYVAISADLPVIGHMSEYELGRLKDPGIIARHCLISKVSEGAVAICRLSDAQAAIAAAKKGGA